MIGSGLAVLFVWNKFGSRRHDKGKKKGPPESSQVEKQRSRRVSMEDTVPGRNLSRTCCNPDCRFMMTENQWMAYCCDIFSQDNVRTGCTAMDSFVFYFIFSNYRWGRCSFLATAQLVFLKATHSARTPSLSLPWITFSVIKGGGGILCTF